MCNIQLVKLWHKCTFIVAQICCKHNRSDNNKSPIQLRIEFSFPKINLNLFKSAQKLQKLWKINKLPEAKQMPSSRPSDELPAK